MVPPYSLRIPRARRYSGYRRLSSPFTYRTLTVFGSASHRIRLGYLMASTVLTPKALLSSVWPLPFSLATTHGISFDFSSSAYLDVSVRRVPRVRLFYSPHTVWLFAIRVSPFGYPRIAGYLLLPVAFRSLSRPSSAPDAKAFSLCPSSLELLLYISRYTSVLSLELL